MIWEEEGGREGDTKWVSETKNERGVNRVKVEREKESNRLVSLVSLISHQSEKIERLTKREIQTVHWEKDSDRNLVKTKGERVKNEWMERSYDE